MKLDPKIEIGKFFLFKGKNFAPNLSNGKVTLEKSLEDKLLSPSSFIFFFEATNKPKINLPHVPEFPALIVTFFL